MAESATQFRVEADHSPRGDDEPQPLGAPLWDWRTVQRVLVIRLRSIGARHRVGFRHYQYARLHNHQAPSSLFLWGEQKAHSVEQQLALIGWTGVPVTDRPPTRLRVTEDAATSVAVKLLNAGLATDTP